MGQESPLLSIVQLSYNQTVTGRTIARVSFLKEKTAETIQTYLTFTWELAAN